MRTWARWLSAAGAALVAIACGPSFQAIYESDALFEHCYALEDTANVPLPEKAHCWRDWSMHSTYGQTRDRVEYAALRYRALTRLPEAPTDEAMMQAAPGEGSDSNTVHAPTPTNAFAPPPNIMSATDAGGSPLRPNAQTVETPSQPPPQQVTGVEPPLASCSVGCNDAWQACGGDCPTMTVDAGARKKTACDACAATYRKCMRSCFK